MGLSREYRCNDCRSEWGAEDGFSFGFLGDVCTTVVCEEHGIRTVDVEVNAREGGTISSVENRKHFPCRECGEEAPRWDAKTCPKCGSGSIEVVGHILWD